MQLETSAAPFRKAFTANVTDTAFAAKIPTATEPSGSGVIDLTGASGGTAQNAALLVPYGTGADNSTFSLRVIGWRRLGSDTETDLWVPLLLAEVACTLSATTGVAGTPVVATERFADTITLTTGNENVSIDVSSPTGDVLGHALVDLKGSQKLELSVDLTGATAANCLVSLL